MGFYMDAEHEAVNSNSSDKQDGIFTESGVSKIEECCFQPLTDYLNRKIRNLLGWYMSETRKFSFLSNPKDKLPWKMQHYQKWGKSTRDKLEAL